MKCVYPNQWAIYGLLSVLLACSQPKENGSDQSTEEPVALSEAQQIIQASIAAHGGQDRWEQLQEIKYVKTVTLFDADGNVETHMKQYHDYSLHPQVSGSISWESAEDSIRVVFENDEAYRLVNGVADAGSGEVAMNTFMAAYHVLFQPFLLGGEGVTLSYLGDETLSNGTEVYVIQPVYENSNGDDWWYYIDKESKRVVGYMVFHVDHHAYVLNLSFDDKTPMVLNHHRKSYRSVSERNIEYIRAEYYYEDYEVRFASPAENLNDAL